MNTKWLEAKIYLFKKALCKTIGHNWHTSEWKYSPFTTYTHYRIHTCLRCRKEEFENEFFDKHTSPQMFIQE